MRRMIVGALAAMALAVTMNVSVLAADCTTESLRYLYSVEGQNGLSLYYWENCGTWWEWLQIDYTAASNGMSWDAAEALFFRSLLQVD